jgi:hypothetical protein
MILDYRGQPIPKPGAGFIQTPHGQPKPKPKHGGGETADTVGFLIWRESEPDAERS